MNTATDIDNRDKDLIISEQEYRITALKGEVLKLRAELEAAHAAIYQAIANL